MSVVIPHQCGDAISLCKSGAGESFSQCAASAIEIAESVAIDRFVRASPDDFYAIEFVPRALQERGDCQRKIHHQAAHGKPRSLASLKASGELKFGNPIIRSEEHTSELQSPCNLVCRLLLE